MENNKIKVSIFVAGQRFNIITEKSEKYVVDLASEIDARINSLCISGEMSRERAAVLTALDYADDSQLDKENISAVKEQIKDYISEIERLKGDYGNLKAEYERLVADNRTVEEMERSADADKKIISDLQAEVKALKKENEALKQQAARSVEPEDIEDREAPPEKDPEITAEDDLFFDEEEPVKPLPQPQKKKKKHDHSYVNPYKQNAEKKKEQKGYTQQRQYSFFDINEE